MLAVNQKGDVILIWKKNSASVAINQHPIIQTHRSRSAVTISKVPDNFVSSVISLSTRCRDLSIVRVILNPQIIRIGSKRKKKAGSCFPAFFWCNLFGLLCYQSLRNRSLVYTFSSTSSSAGSYRLAMMQPHIFLNFFRSLTT